MPIMSPSEDHSPSYFSSIQVLRGAAALLVVVYHLVDAERLYGEGHAWLIGMAQLGYAGVDVFFVISGFVMTTIAAGKYQSASNAGVFLARRAIRILPLYWFYTSVVVALLIFAPSAIGAMYHEKSIVASYLLWPQPSFPLLQVGWTLIYEAYFYILMALAISVLKESWVPIFLGVWAIALVSLQSLHASTPWEVVLANPMGWEFIAGGLIGIYWKRIPARFGQWCLPVGVAGFVGGAATLSHFGLYDQDALRRALIFGSSSALVVVGLIVREQRRVFKPHRLLRAVGDASYSIYLSHLFVVTAAAHVWGRSHLNTTGLEHVVFITATLALAVAIGIASFHWLEVPANKFLGGLLKNVGKPVARRDSAASSIH